MNKQELETEVQQLVALTGTPVKTEGLSNKDLGELINTLKESATEAGIETTPPVVEAPVAVKRPPHYIADGCSLTTVKRGIQGPGDAITADDFAGGQDALEGWIASGHVIKG